jgi:hypothetical protein
MSAATDVPEFLLATLETMAFRRRAGEWDLEPGRPDAVSDLLRAFVESFPWARVDTSEIGASGFEASASLLLEWRDPADCTGRSWVPGSARVQFDSADGILTLTIWPNLFTDRVPIYARDDDRFISRLVPFAPASTHNRACLAGSLKELGARTGGTIVGWDSELVDGVGRHGFEDDARPR